MSLRRICSELRGVTFESGYSGTVDDNPGPSARLTLWAEQIRRLAVVD